MEEVRIKYVSFKFIENKPKKTKKLKIYLILCRIKRQRGVHFLHTKEHQFMNYVKSEVRKIATN